MFLIKLSYYFILRTSSGIRNAVTLISMTKLRHCVEYVSIRIELPEEHFTEITY